MPKYSWPPMNKRAVMGKRTSRVDGPAKASGRAKYSSDVKLPGMLYGAILTCPYAHARVKNVDTGAAKAIKGVEAIRVIVKPGDEIQWAGDEIAYVAAVTEDIAQDAVRAIKVDYEVLPHVVHEADLAKAGTRAKAAGEKVTGDPDRAFKDADAVSEGTYGCPVITHCTLESHGQTIHWTGDKIEYWPSTQGVSTIVPDLAKQLQVPATQVHAQMENMGGGFGSKFPSDRWGAEAGRLSKETGKPVKLFLDRATDVTIAGNRPSAFARIRLAAKKDGTIIGWDSTSWATGGYGGGGMPPIPYVYQKIVNMRLNHSAVSLNAGASRAWRAPNHPQASFLTCSAIDDLAAKLNMDPLEVFLKNVDVTPRPETYRSQLQKAAELMEWKRKWQGRGAGKGVVRRGLGIGVAQWGGAGHASTCTVNINPDATIEVKLGSQDLGTGTRTIIVMVAAETFGLPIGAIKLMIGDSSYPNSGSSGGSTTVGGVSSATRKASVDALEKLFETVAPALNTTADKLEAVSGKIQVIGDPTKSLTWKAACQKLGTRTISVTNQNSPKEAPKEGLNTGGASGVQMAEVEVDTETGVVKLKKLVVVQDCGLIINPKTAESQVFGACTMAICSALAEERIMDAQTGRVLNPDMEFYKLAGIGDIGEIVCHLEVTPEHDARGVIGLGEPPVVPALGAIGNAVANAIGVRVPQAPFTPGKVLAALAGRRMG